MPFQKSQNEKSASGRIYVALGANQAYRGLQPIENLQRALQLLTTQGVCVLRCSRPWRAPAWPDPSDPPFVNAAAEVQSELSPEALMTVLHDVENALGRHRSRPNAPRSLDLDLIDWRGRIQAPDRPGDLHLPHPRASGRAFVLLPLRDIAPDWRDPVTGLAITQLLSRIPVADRSACRPAGGVLCAAV